MSPQRPEKIQSLNRTVAGDSSCNIRGATIKYAWYWIRRESSFCDNQKCMVLNIELGKSSLSSPRTRSGPIASGKTVGLLDTFLIGSLSVYDLLIIIISMIIIMVSTFVYIYDHWSLSSTTMTTQCSLSCQFVVDIFLEICDYLYFILWNLNHQNRPTNILFQHFSRSKIWRNAGQRF